jgi:hypothetical protein
MAQIFFISSQYVKENSIVDENVDEKYIKVAIQNAQRNQLIYIIGSGLYNEIAGQIQNNTLTALNITLLNDYIVPCLLNYTLVELSPYLLYKLSNRNVGVKDAERVSATEFNRLDDIMKKFEFDAELSADRMRRYLITYEPQYPLWTNPGSTVDTIYPRRDSFYCGIYTGKRFNYVSLKDRIEYPGTYGCE